MRASESTQSRDEWWLYLLRGVLVLFCLGVWFAFGRLLGFWWGIRMRLLTGWKTIQRQSSTYAAQKEEIRNPLSGTVCLVRAIKNRPTVLESKDRLGQEWTRRRGVKPIFREVKKYVQVFGDYSDDRSVPCSGLAACPSFTWWALPKKLKRICAR